MVTPSATLLAQHDAELVRFPPFAQMAEADRLQLWAAAEQRYFAPGEVVLDAAAGPVRHLFVLRRGRIEGSRRFGTPDPFTIETGECFPVGAALGERAVSAEYRAADDVFVLALPLDTVRAVAAASAPLGDFLAQRMAQLLSLAQDALHRRAASQVQQAHPLDAPLATLIKGPPLAVPPATPTGEALVAMQARGVGSVLVTDAQDAALGILTRHDLLGRIVLAGADLRAPITQVMSQPVQTLDAQASGHDAALLMARGGLRHVPITRAGRVVGIVSERDLFALQRLSLGQLGTAIDTAGDLPALQAAAAGIRGYAYQLLAQGVKARALTELVSHLNDRLTARIVTLQAAQHGLDLQRACWLAFGSEGRHEQTIATDQDNGLLLADGEDVAAWRRLGGDVNEALAACGFPLCKGGIMAGQPACCLTASAWAQRFAHWITHGSPDDLLAACIFFDLRALAGNTALATAVHQAAVQQAAATPRLLKQLALNALSHRPPLAWHGGIASERIDLKLQGTALVVEAARVLALAAGVTATATRERLLAAAGPLRVPDNEVQAWTAAFEYLQMLRLERQRAAAEDGAGGEGGEGGEADAREHPNACEPARLNEIDRRVLRGALRVVARLQQRLALDWDR